MHRVPNYGSVLQTYATCEILKSLGHSPEVLDYIPGRLRLRNIVLTSTKNKSRLLFPIHLAYSILVNVPKISMYRKFLHDYVKLSKGSYFTINDIQRNLPAADVYMTGSDQVWNTFYDGFIDPTFFLKFVPDGKRKISYAASFGRSVLSKQELDKLKGYITSYDCLSVRESSGVEIIKEMGRYDVHHVLDPTFLLDKVAWSKMFSKRKFPEKYILMYTVNKDEDKLIELVQKIAKAKGLKIYYLHNGLKGIATFATVCCTQYSL